MNHNQSLGISMIGKRALHASKYNKEASRLYVELCESMLKFFILVSRNEADR